MFDLVALEKGVWPCLLQEILDLGHLLPMDKYSWVTCVIFGKPIPHLAVAI